MGEYYRNYAQVNLDHIRNNLELVRATIKKGCKLMVVLKANAYGHGIEQCALACRNADMFAVATLQEALMIRRTGLRTPVLLLGPVDPNEINTVCQNEFTLTISSVSYAEQIQRECERSGQSVLCHVKVDTGLNRTGIRCRTFSVENACEEAGRIFKMPSLKIKGVYTHFACAGSENLDDQAFTQTQYSTFVSFCERMEHLGFSLGLRHCCSTSAFLTHPEMELDMSIENENCRVEEYQWYFVRLCYVGEDYVSILYNDTVYWPGAAHPQSYLAPITIDVKTGAVVTDEEVLGCSWEDISSKIKDSVQESYSDKGAFEQDYGFYLTKKIW